MFAYIVTLHVCYEKKGIQNIKIVYILPIQVYKIEYLVNWYTIKIFLKFDSKYCSIFLFTIFAVDSHSNVQRTLVQIEGCEGTVILVNDQIVLPHIFDFKYRIDNGTYIRADSVDYHYIKDGQDLTVSVIVESPNYSTQKGRSIHLYARYRRANHLPMDIIPLELPT